MPVVSGLSLVVGVARLFLVVARASSFISVATARIRAGLFNAGPFLGIRAQGDGLIEE